MENCKFTTSRSVKRYKFLFVLAIFLSSFLSVYAEDVSNYVEEKTFTFSFENVPLKQVLSHIEKNSEIIHDSLHDIAGKAGDDCFFISVVHKYLL